MLETVRIQNKEPRPLEKVRIPGERLAVFSRQLATMVDCGITLSTALDLLSRQTDDKDFGRLVNAVCRRIHSGYALSDAMSRFPRIFGPLYIALVKVGEQGGTLGMSLNALADYTERDQRTLQRVKSALTYPCVVVVITIVLNVLVFRWLLPQFVGMFEDMHIDLPLVTRVVLMITRVLQSPLTLLLVPLLVAWAVARVRAMQTKDSGRLKIDLVLLSIPVVGTVLRRLAVARFCESFATLLGSGFNLVLSLQYAADASGNEVLRQRIRSHIDRLREGESLASIFAGDGFFEPVVYHMVYVGEETGQLDQLMRKLASYFEREVEHAIDNMAAVLDPVLTVTVGAMVAIVCLAIMLPLYSVIQHLGT
jgi:type IV pilus assembly protein PilC